MVLGRDWAWASCERDLVHLSGGCLDLGLPKERPFNDYESAL